MKTAILTGATGFVGYALLKELIRNNIQVYVLCRPQSLHRNRLNGITGITVIEADLENWEDITELPRGDVFYHLAWESGRNHFDIQCKGIGIAVNRIAESIVLSVDSGIGGLSWIFMNQQKTIWKLYWY